MLIPPPSSDPTEVRAEDVKAFFMSMDEGHDINRQILEKRLREAVGLTIPSKRYR